jgi:predicted hydrocarbon binding protein
MFKEERSTPSFTWKMIGDINLGRPNLGSTTSVAVYRLMQFTLRDILITEVGVEKAERIFYKAGELAGKEFFNNVIPKTEDFNEFIIQLQKSLKDLNIGILRVESADMEKLHFILTVAEDLDCSGLPMCDEEVCTYDEGFINGILSEYTGKNFNVKEIDCWCSGDRVCRFDVKPV